MSTRPVQFSDAAADDIVRQSDWYAMQADESLAARWETAVTSTVLRIADFPNSGALCNFKKAELRDLRRMAVDDFTKHLIFYRTDGESIFIVRVVYGARDLERLI